MGIYVSSASIMPYTTDDTSQKSHHKIPMNSELYDAVVNKRTISYYVSSKEKN